MKIGILKQGIFGGTDQLLGRAEVWLSRNGNVCEYIDDDFDMSARFDCVLLPTSEIRRLTRYVLSGLKLNRILVWSMGHGAFSAAFFNKAAEQSVAFPLVDIIPSLYLKKLIKINAVAFTDLVGLNHDFKRFSWSDKYVKKEDIVVPIAISGADISEPCVIARRALTGLTCCWVGRVSHDFKVEPLIDLIDELNQTQFDALSIKKFYVVGTGDASYYLKSRLRDLDLKFEIAYIDFIPSQELGRFLSNNIDVSFVMGTASLDVAKVGVPTVIVKPYSLFDKKGGLLVGEKKYRFLFDSKGYSLGEFPYSIINPKQPDVNLRVIFQELFHKGFDTVALNCKCYSELFFEEKVFKRLYNRMLNAKSYKVDSTDYLVAAFFKLKEFVKKVLGKGS